MTRSGRFLKLGGFKDTTIDSQRIELDPSVTWVLGPNATFRNCTIHCKVRSSQFIVESSNFIGCQFTATVGLSNVAWSEAKITDCIFAGRFSGCDFGPRPDLGAEFGRGSLEHTDFSAAMLDECRFFNVDMRSILLPTWPSFAITDRRAAAEDFLQSGLLDAAQNYAQAPFGHAEDGEVAFCAVASKEAKRLGCSTESLRSLLEGKAYVVL